MYRAGLVASLVAVAWAQPQRPFDPAEPARRARAGEARLAAAGAAGGLVRRAIERHGGLEAWFAGRALRFRYAYTPVGGQRPPRDSVQTVDLLASRAYHEMTSPAQGRFAFDGERCWASFPEPAKVGARFWALTPYYFVGMPFVLADPGVNLEVVADDPAASGLPPADVVRVTFGPGVGDAPDDYYVVSLAKDDGRLLGLRYVVSYKPFMRGGVKHTPEKLLIYGDERPVGALRLAHRHDFYAFTDGRRAEKVTVATVSEAAYAAPFDEARLRMPPGAHLDTALSGP